ncbi:MAG: co-chaperone GroES [Planctomycetota bacterium]|nr:co-chaperone GroES [Planctomycetota bacterium]
MKLIPIGDKVIVERLAAEERTKGGIVLPDTAKEKPKEGRVISVGEGRLLDGGSRAKPSVKQGDRIIFASYAGSEVKVEGKEYLIMNDEDILAVIEEK